MTRKELVKKVETNRPPIKVVISKNDKQIEFKNVPTIKGRYRTYVVDLEGLNETPEQYLQSLINEDDIKLCTFCGKSVGGFKDESSAREFIISGLCQSCQDKTFKENKNEKRLKD